MSSVKERNEIAQKDTWNLADLFESNEAFEAAFRSVKEQIPSLTAFKGRLSDKKQLKAFFEKEHTVSLTAERLFVYAKMSRDTDNGNDEAVARCDRAYNLLTELEAETSFVTPELNKLSDETLLSLASDEAFKDNSVFLKELVRNKAHVLSEGEERLLALSGEMANSFDTIFTMLDDVDLQFDKIKMPDGTLSELSHGLYGIMLRDKDREVRRQAYESMYNAHISHINTLASLYASSVKKDIFYSTARNFPSALDAELFSGNIPVSVYDNLTEAMHGFFPALHRYVALRKQLLGLDDMKMYDMYVPIVDTPEESFTFDEAKQLAREALAPLGDEYISLLDRAFNERWIDVYETKGKTSGAYSWGAYGVHPYMLLNFQGKLDDVFTLVHESGHSMHTYFSDHVLPYEKAQYRIFVAEVASTVNEVLLLKYLLKNSRDDKTRAYLLNHLLEQFRTTVFRQTMFAEFERKTHKMQESGESLTVNALNTLYGDLNRAYYSETVETDKYIETEWARIPHFYNCYYVYQYATGFSAAVAIADNILNNGATARDSYIKFLSSGGSDYPIELLKIAGVDLSTKEPIISSLNVFESTLKEFEELMKK